MVVVGREAQLESGGLKPDFCLHVDLAHKAQCGLTLKIINMNVVPVGLNDFTNIVGVLVEVGRWGEEGRGGGNWNPIKF